MEIMTHILLNLPGEYKNIVEKLEEELYDNINTLMIKIIRENLSAKCDRMGIDNPIKRS